MSLRRCIVSTLIATLAAACGQAPIRPAATHVRAEQAPAPAAEGAVPPVQSIPLLPKPRPSVRPETYSVVVSNVRVHDLLFALARDARLNVDIHPDVTGNVTLNAVDQTLMQLLARISRQADVRFELVGENLVVMRDTPYLKAYRVDYVSAERRVEMSSSLSTQFGAAGAGGGAPTSGISSGTTGSTAKVDIRSTNRLWETVVENVKEILQETDKVLPTATTAAAPAAVPAAPAGAGQPAGAPAGSPPAPANVTFREAASVIANRESGTLYVRATSRQHEKIQEFLDQVMANVKQQVLIEVTVAEVALTDEFQRGIDWEAIRTTSGGALTTAQTSVTRTPQADLGAFTVGYARTSGNFTAAIKFLETFGSVRVLSSPKLSVLNNQTALLRVTKDLVYFILTPQPVTVSGAGGTVNLQPTFTSSPNVAAEGFMMGVLPQIGELDSVVLNVRPTIRRKIADVLDPNPELKRVDVTNAIPVFETREFESILRVQSGEIAVLGGLMQDSTEVLEGGVPLVSELPLIGWLFKQTSQITRKTELVIFIRPTVVKDASVGGDFSRFREHLPTERFFVRPDPARKPPAEAAPSR